MALAELAAKFVISPPPPDYAGRLQFLAQHLSYCAEIVEKLPEPDYVDDSAVISDMDKVRRALDTMSPQLNVLKIAGTTLRNVILGMWHVASYGAGLHAPDWRQAVLTHKIMTAAELEADYLGRIGTLQAIITIAETGALDPLFKAKKPALGAFDPVSLAIIAAVIIALSLAATAALAYYTLQWAVLSRNNNQAYDAARKLCFDKSGNPIPAVQKDCIKILQDIHGGLSKNGPPDPMGDILKYAAIAGAVYVGVLILPDVIRGFREARQASKA